jgi:hypothetical protein
MVNLVSKLFVRRLAGLFQTISINVIEPTVIKTTESTVLDSAVAQIGPAMRTMQPQQTGSAPIVAKKDEILA